MGGNSPPTSVRRAPSRPRGNEGCGQGSPRSVPPWASSMIRKGLMRAKRGTCATAGDLLGADGPGTAPPALTSPPPKSRWDLAPQGSGASSPYGVG